KFTPVPFNEADLWNGYPEETNAPYGLAKKMLLVQAQAYRAQYGLNAITLLPVNLYGPHDNFDLTSSHVLPALIRKFHDAKASGATEVEIWGTGSPMREFLHVDDLADACLHLMRNYSDDSHINVGSGIDLSIRELAEKVRDLVYPTAALRFDTSKPDGTPRKVLDVSRLEATGWTPKIDLDTGLKETYQWFLDQRAAHADLRGIETLVSATD
ncbi:MAG: NAD-dependent epimerase/dehydratase family protein, partial [Ilumatobacteraceae bacterium]